MGIPTWEEVSEDEFWERVPPELDGVTWHTLRHTFFPAIGSRGGYSDSPAIARAFNCHRNHALYAHKSRFKEGRRRETRKF